MKILLYISRILVGSLFIVSGLVKANDPLGFSYKLEEYFAESALNLPFLEPYALLLGTIACIAEIVLGFAVIFGGKMKLASWSLLILTLFFGWLTYYTATCDPQGTYTIMENGQEVVKSVTCVTDCGCFGDALKGSLGRSLTPWESFSKDMILLLFIIPIFIKRASIKVNEGKEEILMFVLSLGMVAFLSWVFAWIFPTIFYLVGYAGYFLIKKILSENKSEWTAAAFVTLLSIGFSYYCYANLPIRDYRPFAVGKSIPEQMAIPEGAKRDKYDVVLTYKNTKTGEVKDFKSDNYPWNDTITWVWVNTQSVLVEKGYEAPIHDFQITDVDGNDYTEDILAEPYIFLLISYDINKADKDIQAKVNEFQAKANTAGYYMYGVSASSADDVQKFKHETQSMVDYYQADATTLKTIVRSNPGLVLLKEGTVLGLWHFNNFPDFETVDQELIKGSK